MVLLLLLSSFSIRNYKERRRSVQNQKLTYKAKPSMLMNSEIRGEAEDFMFDYGLF